MNITTSNNSRRLTLEYQTLIGIMVILALMLYGVWRYPASLSQGGLVSFLVTVGALLAYGGAALWARRQSSDRMQITLGNGVKIGLLLGVTAVLNHTFEIFGTLGSSVSAILGVSMWGLMFLSFGVAGSATYHLVGSLRLSIISSIWGALISTVIILLYGYLVALLFMPHMQPKRDDRSTSVRHPEHIGQRHISHTARPSHSRDIRLCGRLRARDLRIRPTKGCGGLGGL